MHRNEAIIACLVNVGIRLPFLQPPCIVLNVLYLCVILSKQLSVMYRPTYFAYLNYMLTCELLLCARSCKFKS